MSRSVIYSKLAVIYDQVMEHVDYVEWSDYVSKVLRHAGVQPVKNIDLSCGTGNFLRHFLHETMLGFGGDRSIEMILQAKKKIYRSSCRFFVGDACRIPLKNECCDAVFFLYDSINYVLSGKKLSLLFGEVKRVLNHRGIFIFDTVTEKHCLDNDRQFNEAVYWNDCGYEKTSSYDKGSGMQITNFRILIGDEYFRERHLQKIHRPEYLLRLLEKIGFKCSLFDGFSLRPAHLLSQRIHFMCHLRNKRNRIQS